ncbi:MAG TPA: molybdopterin-synthase adenylyltransferase MoeB [Chthoniobacterales bacterium]|nr:molybdopterin-synthase adenylyltransferase MoeB [Chthoniobacterales bacterium]
MSIIEEERLAEIVLNAGDLSRYSRQLLLPEVNADGQRRIKAARVLCIGAGGLGSPAALYLAAAGIGTLGLVDAVRVDVSNLQRQILYGTDDVGESKLEKARARLRQLNPDVEIVLHETRLTSANATEIIAHYDIVIDGSDNFPTRYLSNDVCVWARKPNIYGSVFRFEGQASVFAPHLGGPCYRCLFPEPPPPGAAPSCAEAGVLGVLPGIIGLIQATEALKLIVGAGESLAGRLLHFDALKMKFREFNLRRDPQCPVCGDAPTIFEPIDYEQFCAGPAEADWFAAPERVPTISVKELKAKMDKGEAFTLIDVRESFEYDIAHIPASRLIPLAELESRISELPRTGTLILQCHSGGRSEHAAHLLREAGFDNAVNLVGGIDAWSVEIDPAVPRY